MMISQSLLAYLVAAAILTLTPGVDTALVLRARMVEGSRRAALAAFGVGLGCLVWGAAVALGVGALVLASPIAFEALKWAGAAYLFWLGVQLLLKPRRTFADTLSTSTDGPFTWFWRGLFGNLLNPKVGMFYISFLPQFVPPGVAAAPYTLLLAGLHVGLGFLWFAVLILATRPFGKLLRRPRFIAALDRLTGCVFLAFGLRLALSGGRN